MVQIYVNEVETDFQCANNHLRIENALSNMIRVTLKCNAYPSTISALISM